VLGCSTTPEEKALELVAAYGGEVRTNTAGQITAVDLSDSSAGDDVIAAIAVFPTINTLNCSNASRVTGQGFATWSPEARIESLYLVGTALDDAGLQQVGHLGSLKTLQLGQTKITDAGLPALDRLINLETLSLSNTAVTDIGLISLRDLRKLSTLMIREANTTPRGVLELRRMLPDARVVD
jgi:hypothetical protein